MSKKIKLFSVALVVFVVVLMAFAGTALASYNMTTHTGDHSAVAGTVHDRHTTADPNPCDFCHIPHGANGTTGYLWGNKLSTNTNGNTTTGQVTTNDDAGVGSIIKQLCYSCHDGTIAHTGVDTVFSTAHTNHRTNTTTHDCNLCHDPHDNGNKQLLVPATGLTSATATYTGESDFLVYEHHSTYPPGTDKWSVVYPGGFVCTSCHGNMATDGSTHALLVVPGTVPANSHAPIDQSFLPGGDYSGSRLFDPATLLVSTDPTAVVACESCHTPHGADPSATYVSSGKTYHGLNTMKTQPKLDAQGKPLPYDPSDPTTLYLCVNCH